MFEFMSQDTKVIDMNEELTYGAFSRSLRGHKESIRKEYMRREEVERER